jgi:GNAT superfamily N-acetyltransferase
MAAKKEEVEICRVPAENAAWKKQFDTFYADFPPSGSVTAMPHAYFAAYHNGVIVAHSVVYKKGSQWILDGLRVSPAWRERGIGKALTAARIRYAVKNGAKEIWYDCEDGNLVTTCCHLRFGFRKICPRSRSGRQRTVHRYRLTVAGDLPKRLNT